MPTADKQPYWEFAQRLIGLMARERVTSKAVIKETGVDPESERLWRKGERMPKRENMKVLAKMLGVTVAELRDGEITPRGPMPGSFTLHDADEVLLIETYRKLEPWAKDALRARAAQLLQDFGSKGPENPFGKKASTPGTQ